MHEYPNINICQPSAELHSVKETIVMNGKKSLKKLELQRCARNVSNYKSHGAL